MAIVSLVSVPSVAGTIAATPSLQASAWRSHVAIGVRSTTGASRGSWSRLSIGSASHARPPMTSTLGFAVMSSRRTGTTLRRPNSRICTRSSTTTSPSSLRLTAAASISSNARTVRIRPP